MSVRLGLGLLIGAGVVGRLAWAAGLGPGNDEAYFLLYARHPDWSYFDHPPMVAWIAQLGLLLGGKSPSILAMRSGFIALFAGSTWLIYRLTARGFGPRAGLMAAFVLSVAGYFPMAAGSFALPDGPLLFFWLLTLDRVAATLSAGRRHRDQLLPWVFVGLAWGGALLSKYHAVLLPIGIAVYLLSEPYARGWLRRPGPYLALAVGLLVFAPVLGWNAAHGWVSFRFQGGRGVEGSWWPRPDRAAEAVLGSALYLLPWVWASLVTAWIASLASRRKLSAGERFFVTQATAVIGIILLIGSSRRLLPHWSLVGFLTLVPLAGARLATLRDRAPARYRIRLLAWAGLPLVVCGTILLHASSGLLQRAPGNAFGWLAPSRDPTLDLYGWKELTDALAESGLIKESDQFLFTSKWYHSGQLAFAGVGERPVLCYSGRAALGFGQWTVPEAWVGRDGVLAVINHSSTEPAAFDRWFEQIEPMGELCLRRSGEVVKVVKLYRCTAQRQPFPYGDLAPSLSRDDPRAADPVEHITSPRTPVRR